MGAVVAIVAGVGIVLLGVTMFADYRQFRSKSVDNFAPKWTPVSICAG